MDFLELEADSISEAVTKACRKLKVTEDQLDVEVLREGEFEEPYLVRVSIKKAAPAPRAAAPAPAAPAPRPAAPRPVAPVDDFADDYEEDAPPARAPRREAPPRAQAPRAEAPAAAPRVPRVPKPKSATPTVYDREDELGLAIGVLQDFLDSLDVDANVTGEIKDDQIQLEVDSDDGGTLIGRKGATLNALQHVINSVVRSSKHRVIVDIAGYRARSAERLEEIAQRVAQQARETGRRVELKPMTPAERRIVHMAIAAFEDLSTESIGEEPNRRIVVIPPGAPPLPPSREPRRSMGRDDRGGDRRGPRPEGGRPPMGDRDRRPPRPAAAPGMPGQGRPAARTGGGGVDRWGYTRDIPAEAKDWIDENQTVVPIGRTPAPANWNEFAEEPAQPWVKDQPVYRQAPPDAAPGGWGGGTDTDYREGSSAEDRW